MALAGVGKPIGVALTGAIPSPELFARQTGWSWFLLGAKGADLAERPDALRRLYADPRIVSEAAGGETPSR